VFKFFKLQLIHLITALMCSASNIVLSSYVQCAA